MKKILAIALFAILNYTNCLALDKFGVVYPDSVSGSEAKSMIMEKAILGALIHSSNSDFILAIIAPELAKVKTDRYYNKVDVEKCASDALLINAITVNIGGFTCNLNPHEYVIEGIL